MKKSMLLVAVLGLGLALAGPAEAARKKAARSSSGERMQDITVNPLGLVFGLGNVTYEKALSLENSFTAGVSFASYGILTSQLTMIGATGAYRWWFTQEKPMSGWYAGPEVNIINVNWSYKVFNTSYSASGMMFGGGGQGGYQWIFDSGFTLNLGLALGYLAGSVSSNVVGAPSLGFGGPYTGGNLGLGYAF